MLTGFEQQEPAQDDVFQLLQQMGIREPSFALHLLKGGWNNRVYRLVVGDFSFVLKAYFYSESDSRPRLAHEWAFLRYCHKRGINCVPQSLAILEPVLGLYSWIEGHAYGGPAAPVLASEIQTALSFIQELNQNSGNNFEFVPDNLPLASEFCGDLMAHVEHLERRMQRFIQMPKPTQMHQKVHQLVVSRLQPLWHLITDNLTRDSRKEPGILRPLDLNERCLSPSDFGFHNALKTATGPVFIDFEYAGWDDPAQLVCDFFSQFQVPVPAEAWSDFAGAVASWYPEPDWQLKRMSLLRSTHDLKWICIALNHFLHHDSHRRAFAAPAIAADSEQGLLQIQQQQYNKALLLIEKLETQLK